MEISPSILYLHLVNLTGSARKNGRDDMLLAVGVAVLVGQLLRDKVSASGRLELATLKGAWIGEGRESGVRLCLIY
jgi:hypothetical protein